jgi:hypothetical protein
VLSVAIDDQRIVTISEKTQDALLAHRFANIIQNHK